MQNYDFLLNASNLVQLIQASGVNVYYKTGTEAAGNSGVRVKGEGGAVDVILLPGEGLQLPAGQSRFTLSKGDAGAGDIAGTFLIGNGQFFASRVQGDVSITNVAGLAVAKDARLIDATDQAGRWGAVGGPPTLAGRHWGFWLRNPAASGVVLLVDHVLVTRNAAPNSSGTIFGSLAVDAATAGVNGSAETAGISELDGSTVLKGLWSTAEGASSAQAGYIVAQSLGEGVLRRVYQNDPFTPYVVLPGRALKASLLSLAAADVTSCRMHWIERAL